MGIPSLSPSLNNAIYTPVGPLTNVEPISSRDSAVVGGIEMVKGKKRRKEGKKGVNQVTQEEKEKGRRRRGEKLHLYIQHRPEFSHSDQLIEKNTTEDTSTYSFRRQANCTHARNGRIGSRLLRWRRSPYREGSVAGWVVVCRESRIRSWEGWKGEGG